MSTEQQIRKGNWFQTFTGRSYWPADPRPEDIDIEDIAHALSMLCRFGGHCRRFYSVAEHSIHVSHLVPPEYALHALLHDATEAYLVDVPRPIKRMLGGYAEMEELNWRAIAARFGIDPVMPRSVHDADQNMLLAERDQLLVRTDRWDEWRLGIEAHHAAADYKVYCLFPENARDAFLHRFHKLIDGSMV